MKFNNANPRALRIRNTIGVYRGALFALLALIKVQLDKLAKPVQTTACLAILFQEHLNVHLALLALW